MTARPAVAASQRPIRRRRSLRLCPLPPRKSSTAGGLAVVADDHSTPGAAPEGRRSRNDRSTQPAPICSPRHTRRFTENPSGGEIGKEVLLADAAVDPFPEQ